MTTLERAARAQYEARGPKLSIPRMGIRWAGWDELSPETKANEIAAFRAGLLSIREPDEGMRMAGMGAPRSAETAAATNTLDRQSGLAGDLFTAMIDHIIQEHSE